MMFAEAQQEYAIASQYSLEDVELELLHREAAYRHLIDFSTYIVPWYQDAPHHRLVAGYLEQVELYIRTGGEEGIGRLMIFEPPRYGKSTQVSQIFPAWLLGRNPDYRIILASYGVDLAETDSKAARDIIMDPRFASVFGLKSMRASEPVEISDSDQSRVQWELQAPHRGGAIACGVGGRITGFGAHLLNINDPFKGREQALSEAYRRKVRSWYRGDAYSRLEKGGAIIITHTRWDQDDLAGELLKVMASDDELVDQWTVVFLPEIALEEDQYPQNEDEFRENLLRGVYIPQGADMLDRQPGEVLWPWKYPAEVVRAKHANVLDFEAMSQYQQMPRLASGEFFDEVDFRYVEKRPNGLQWYCYLDLALGKNIKSDKNSAIRVAMDDEGNLYARNRTNVRRLEEFMAQVKTAMLSDEEKGTIWGVEDVAFQSLVFKEFMKDKTLANVSIQPVRPENDKIQRARPWQQRAKQGMFFLIRAAWNLPFIRIATSFPNGSEDDDVDSISGGVQMIAEGGNGWVEYYKRRKEAMETEDDPQPTEQLELIPDVHQAEVLEHAA